MPNHFKVGDILIGNDLKKGTGYSSRNGAIMICLKDSSKHFAVMLHGFNDNTIEYALSTTKDPRHRDEVYSYIKTLVTYGGHYSPKHTVCREKRKNLAYLSDNRHSINSRYKKAESIQELRYYFEQCISLSPYPEHIPFYRARFERFLSDASRYGLLSFAPELIAYNVPQPPL